MYSIHPAGQFEATISNHGYSMTSTGTHQFWVQFETKAGSLRGFFFLSDKAIEHTIAKIRAMGYDGDNLEELADGTRLAGLMCLVTVEHDNYNGKTSAKVSFVDAWGTQRGAKRDNEVAAKVKMFNALLKRTEKGKPVRAEADATPAPRYDEANPPPANWDTELPI